MQISDSAKNMAELLLKYHPMPSQKVAEKGQPDAQEPAVVKRTDKYSIDYSEFDKIAAGEAESRSEKVKQYNDPVTAQFAHTHDKRKQRELYERPTLQKLQNAEYFKEQGNEAYAKGQYDKASYMYEKAIIHFDYTFPQNEEQEKMMENLKEKCHMNLALCRYHMKDLEQAMHNLRLVLKINPKNVKAVYRQAIIALDKDDFASSHQYIAKLKELGENTKSIEANLSAKQTEYVLKSKKISQNMLRTAS